MSSNRNLRRKEKRQARSATQAAKALSQYPEVIRSLRLVQQLRDSGQSEKAIDLCRQLVDVEPRNVNIHIALAGALQDCRQFDEAIGVYRHCVELAPGSAAAFAQLAQCLAAVGDLPGCIASCKAALRLVPGTEGIHQLAGRVYQRMARFSDAAVHFKALADKTGHHADFEQLGQTLFQTNDIDAASVGRVRGEGVLVVVPMP